MNTPVTKEISRWSDLPDFVESYNQQISQQGGVSRIFGYASIINNHTAEKPPESSGLANEPAKLAGLEVAMNVFATGQFEFRGTTDAERGIHNVGLYAGLEPSLKPDGYAEGVNITVAPENAAQSFKAYLSREIGNPPQDFPVDELVVQNGGKMELSEKGKSFLSSLKGTPQDDFGLYKLQVVEVDANAGKVPALTVSTNEKSPFAAIGLSPAQAAHYILDGQGYSRPAADGKGALGGSALDYFNNTLSSQKDYGITTPPRLQAIAEEVIKQSEAVKGFDEGMRDASTVQQRAAQAEKALASFPEAGVTSVTPRYFGHKDVVPRGTPSAEVKAANSLPVTGADKHERIASLVKEGKLDGLKAAVDTLKANASTSPVNTAISSGKEKETQRGR